MSPFDDSKSPISERHVQALWYDAALRPAVLRAGGGVFVRVLDPGTWNLGAGPDFRRALLEVGSDRRRVSGDVEVHLRPADWTAHGHGGDAAYREVVAHVTWRGGVPPPTLPSGCMSICLGDFFRCRPDFSPRDIDLQAYPHARLPNTPRPCEKHFGGNPDFGLEVLREAGRRRLFEKAGRFKTAFVRRGNPEQVFYEEVLAAFGYAKNADAFRRLGRTLPLAELPREAEPAFEALKCAAALGASHGAAWAANGRPRNAPGLRIEDAAAVFTGGKPRHLGCGRAAAVVANVVVPYALARGAVKDPPFWLPPEDVSSPMRLAARRLFGRDHNPALYSRNGVLLQGLIQIHRDYCLSASPDCAGCPLADWCENALCSERKVVS